MSDDRGPAVPNPRWRNGWADPKSGGEFESNAPGGPWACDTCGEQSDRIYRCTECGADLVDESGGESSGRHMT